jgi:hypothetical protein
MWFYRGTFCFILSIMMIALIINHAEAKPLVLQEDKVNEIAEKKLTELATKFVIGNIEQNLSNQYCSLLYIFEPVIRDVENGNTNAIPNDMLKALWTLGFTMIVMEELTGDENLRRLMAEAIYDFRVSGKKLEIDNDKFTNDQAKFQFSYMVAEQLIELAEDSFGAKGAKTKLSDEDLTNLRDRFAKQFEEKFTDRLARKPPGEVKENSDGKKKKLTKAEAKEKRKEEVTRILTDIDMSNGSFSTALRITANAANDACGKSPFVNSETQKKAKDAAELIFEDQLKKSKSIAFVISMAEVVFRASDYTCSDKNLDDLLTSRVDCMKELDFTFYLNKSLPVLLSAINTSLNAIDMKQSDLSFNPDKDFKKALEEGNASGDLAVDEIMKQLNTKMAFRSPKTCMFHWNDGTFKPFRNDEILQLVLELATGLQAGIKLTHDENGKEIVTFDKSLVVSSLAKQWADVNRRGWGPILNVGTGYNYFHHWFEFIREVDKEENVADTDDDAEQDEDLVEKNPTLEAEWGFSPLVYEKIGFRYLWPYKGKKLNGIFSGQSAGVFGSGILANMIRDHEQSYEIHLGAQYALHFSNSIIFSVAPSLMVLLPDDMTTGEGEKTIPFYYTVTLGLEFGLWEYMSEVE